MMRSTDATRRWAFFNIGAFMCGEDTGQVHNPARRLTPLQLAAIIGAPAEEWHPSVVREPELTPFQAQMIAYTAMGRDSHAFARNESTEWVQFVIDARYTATPDEYGFAVYSVAPTGGFGRYAFHVRNVPAADVERLREALATI